MVRRVEDANILDDNQEPEQKASEYVEYVGRTGTAQELGSVRTISRKEARDGWDVDLPEGMKELRWDKGNRHRIRTSDLSPEIVEILTTREVGFRLTSKP